MTHAATAGGRAFWLWPSVAVAGDRTLPPSLFRAAAVALAADFRCRDGVNRRCARPCQIAVYTWALDTIRASVFGPQIEGVETTESTENPAREALI